MEERILMGHGSGGRMMHQLLDELIVPAFDMTHLADSAVLEFPPEGRMAVTTDSYVVSPLFFPGGDIGKLAVCGTVNDLSMAGARPLYITAGLILEEGLLLNDLKKIILSMAETARQAGVRIVAGDTKVVERGKCDSLFINTAGVGVLPASLDLSARMIQTGDAILISGPVGTHGIAVMAERNGLTFEPPILSDTAPLNGLVFEMMGAASGIRIMRDPTRGGLATALKEFAAESSFRMTLRESDIPILPGVRGACELLGLDPLYVANEGILTAIIDPGQAEIVLQTMQDHPLGKNAAVIGKVRTEKDGKVLLETEAGGTRILDMLTGEQLPRIC